MSLQHQEMAAGKWQKMSVIEQLANIGSEVNRAISWRQKSNDAYSHLAFERALELLDLSVADKKNSRRLKELLRVREALADFFVFDNSYQSTAESWRKYFLAFNYAARINN